MAKDIAETYLDDKELLDHILADLDTQLASNPDITDLPSNYMEGSVYLDLIYPTLSMAKDFRNQIENLELNQRRETMDEETLELFLYEHGVPRKLPQKAKVLVRVGRKSLSTGQIVTIKPGLTIQYMDDNLTKPKRFIYEGSQEIDITEGIDPPDSKSYYTKEIEFTSDETDSYPSYNNIPGDSAFEIGFNEDNLDIAYSVSESRGGTDLESFEEMRKRALSIGVVFDRWTKSWIENIILGEIEEITYCKAYRGHYNETNGLWHIVISNADHSLTESAVQKVRDLLLEDSLNDTGENFTIKTITETIKIDIQLEIEVKELLDLSEIDQKIIDWFSYADEGKDFILSSLYRADFWSEYPLIESIDFTGTEKSMIVPPGYRASSGVISINQKIYEDLD